MSASTIAGLEPLLQQFGIEYLTYTIGDNDYRVPRSLLFHLCLILTCSNSPSSLLCRTDRRAGFHDRPKAVGEVWTSQVTSCHACSVSSRAGVINGAVHIPLNRLLLAKHAIAFGAGCRNVIDQLQQSPSARALVIGSGHERLVLCRL